MQDSSPFLSTLRPSQRAQRAALGVAVVSAIVFLAVAPFAKTALAPVPAFLPVYQSALVVCDVTTAALLFGQYAILHSRALLLLAAGYLFGALMAVAHALSFPGLFAPGGLMGAGGQTTAWLYFLWHAGFPLFVIAYALQKDAPPRARGRAWPAIAGGIFTALALAGACVLLTTAGHALLPPIMAGNVDAPAKVVVAAATWLFAVAALAVLWRRRPHSMLDLWLMVVVAAWMADTALAAVFNAGRYDVGWYAGRVYGLAASAFVLIVLLLENGILHAQLALARDELAAKNAQLAEASRLKSEFLANMSHELRTPLNAVIGFSEVLKEGLAGPLTADQRAYANDIHSNGHHLLALINDVLDLSKIEAGRMSLDLETTDAATLVEQSLAIVRERAAQHRVRLAGDVARAGGLVKLDPRKTKQILYNLLSNAVKFTPDGGSVTLRAQRVSRAQLDAWQPDAPTLVRPAPPSVEAADYLQIEVEDSGVGIAPQDTVLLFRMFSQLDSSLAREVEGTGLGLALVQRLAQLHGGTVGLASTLGAGSCFVVWLPWRDGMTVPADPAPAARAARRRPERPLALVIEDNDHAAELIRLQLEREGFAIARAASAHQALEWLRTGMPTVVVLDLLLPDMDGWDLLARLKQPELGVDHVPVVIVSIVADTHRGFSLGASAVLQKPVSRDELMAALADCGLARRDRPARVLVADDDPRAVELLAAYLQGADCEVLRAHGGVEAIEAARHQRPDLIVLDLMMPEVSGIDVVEVLKDSADTAGIPIVVVTAKTLTAADKATLNGLVQGVLQKADFDEGGFVNEVRRAVAERQGAAA